MVTIDLSQLPILATVLGPAFVAMVAGALRQDNLSDNVNGLITFVIVMLVAATDALFNHKLVHDPLTDFVVVATYVTALLSDGPLSQLQGFMQSNVLNFTKQAASIPVQPQPGDRPITVADLNNALQWHGQQIQNQLSQPSHTINQPTVATKVIPPQKIGG